VVDVTHDGDHRRTRQQLVVVLVRELRVEVDVEGPEQLAVLLPASRSMSKDPSSSRSSSSAETISMM